MVVEVSYAEWTPDGLLSGRGMITQDAIRPKTILIVEDNELNMRLWSDVLEAQSYALRKTASGVEAVEIARQDSP